MLDILAKYKTTLGRKAMASCRIRFSFFRAGRRRRRMRLFIRQLIAFSCGAFSGDWKKQEGRNHHDDQTYWDDHDCRHISRQPDEGIRNGRVGILRACLQNGRYTHSRLASTLLLPSSVTTSSRKKQIKRPIFSLPVSNQSPSF